MSGNLGPAVSEGSKALQAFIPARPQEVSSDILTVTMGGAE